MEHRRSCFQIHRLAPPGNRRLAKRNRRLRSPAVPPSPQIRVDAAPDRRCYRLRINGNPLRRSQQADNRRERNPAPIHRPDLRSSLRPMVPPRKNKTKRLDSPGRRRRRNRPLLLRQANHHRDVGQPLRNSERTGLRMGGAVPAQASRWQGLT